jgi:hypothetical protein
VLRALTTEIDARPVGLARIIIGVAALIRAFVAWRVLYRLTDPEVLRAPVAPWLPEPDLPLVISIIAGWVISAILFTLGWRVSITGPVLLGAIVVTLSLDQQAYSNHLYLMAWLVLLLTLASAGSGVNIRRSDSPVVRWPVLLLMIQLSIVYGFSALTKFNESFFSGEVLAGTLGYGLLPFPDSFRTPFLLSVTAAAVVFVELFIAIFIWRRRFRPAAFLVGLGLHVSITLLMSGTLELLVFSLQMLALYPLFLSRDPLVVIWDDECGWCRNWIGRFKRIDVLDVLRPLGKADCNNPVPAAEVERAMHLVHLGETSSGFRAVTLTLEHLVPTLWIAPILRLPGVRSVGEAWYAWQARRRSCRLVDVSGP